eukprot:GHVS01068282.1.p1 GENE.GHVS01068282.1~~GHVS01068282.1.p1  ORF type:complete len:304 (-),score=44.46 GHVS01068282.1:166-1077(-)
MLRNLIDSASSFSTSVGPALPKVGDMIMRYKTNCRPATLYGCENDHKAVESLAQHLEGCVEVVSCMVDRICTGRVIAPDKIVLRAEPDSGSIVVLTPQMDESPMSCMPAFAGDNVTIPSSGVEAKYFANRKITIVNGMHTTLAFITLVLKNPTSDAAPGDYELMNVENMPADKQSDVWAWAVGRVLLLLWQHDLAVIKHAHNAEQDETVVDILLAYARKSLNRFSTIQDTTGRVLGGGVANRWMTRLKNVDSFLMASDISQIPLGNLVLSKSGVEEGFLLRAVRRLCQDSYRFTNLSVVELMS